MVTLVRTYRTSVGDKVEESALSEPPEQESSQLIRKRDTTHSLGLPRGLLRTILNVLDYGATGDIQVPGRLETNSPERGPFTFAAYPGHAPGSRLRS